MGTMLERARVAEDLLENMSRLFAGVRRVGHFSVDCRGVTGRLHRHCRGHSCDHEPFVTADHATTRLCPAAGSIAAGYARANYSTLHRAGSARRCYRQCLSESSIGTGNFRA